MLIVQDADDYFHRFGHAISLATILRGSTCYVRFPLYYRTFLHVSFAVVAGWFHCRRDGAILCDETLWTAHFFVLPSAA